MKYNNFCLSSFLTFRYVVDKDQYWKDMIKSDYPEASKDKQFGVKTAEEVYQKLKLLTNIDKNTGILLSGGIDSAILASFLPKGAKAYTIKFVADGAIDESQMASLYAKEMNLDIKVINVYWQDYLDFSEHLMKQKKSPLHAIEVALYKASKAANEDGITKLIVGNGADSTFGGMDKLLAKDWTYDEFVSRYTFIDPATILKEPVSMDDRYSKYKNGNGFDVQGFLKVVHGAGIIQTFENAIHSAGCQVIAPYEDLYLDAELDIKRVRNGCSKYILRDVFSKIYPDIKVPEKIPFARPMDQWLADWEGPTRTEFIENIDISKLTGDQRWLIYNLENFLNLFE